MIVAGVALLGIYRLNQTHPNPASDVNATNAQINIVRGERLAYLCVDCHASTGDLPLDGVGSAQIEESIGTLAAPNLTPGGPLVEWSDGEIIRAIREGIDNEGRTLLLMPSDQYCVMSDEDVQALVAYLRSQPAVERQTPPRQLNLPQFSFAHSLALTRPKYRYLRCILDVHERQQHSRLRPDNGHHCHLTIR